MPPDPRSKSIYKPRKPIPPWAGPVPDTMLIEEASPYLRLPISSIYERTAPGAVDPIPHVRIGRLVRFKRADLDRWLEARNTAAAKSAKSKPAKKAARR
jgi:excisionase family DNA binding protein